MNIISNYSKDTQTDKELPGSYEWWYFDAVSVEGYKLVVIFYEGNPFSRRYIQALERGEEPKAAQYPAVSISVYKNEEPVFYSFREVEPSSAEFSSEIPYGSVEKCYFRGGSNQTRLEYELNLNQELPCGDSINANLLFSSDLYTLPQFPAVDRESNENHEWNLVMPSGYVKGTVRIDGVYRDEVEFTGLGYHDHNTGFKPLKDSFQEWYWGRFHLEDSTFVYYLMNRNNSWINKAWLIGKDSSVAECENFKITNYGLSLFGLKTARVIECNSQNKDFFIQLDVVLESGPFYQRFGGRILQKGKKGVKEARGIAEYIKPSKIYDKKFWPLVNMRISYPGNVHWVQKNPTLYRWTW